MRDNRRRHRSILSFARDVWVLLLGRRRGNAMRDAALDSDRRADTDGVIVCVAKA